MTHIVLTHEVSSLCLAKTLSSCALAGIGAPFDWSWPIDGLDTGKVCTQAAVSGEWSELEHPWPSDKRRRLLPEAVTNAMDRRQAGRRGTPAFYAT